jgi:hypothetical protein
MAAATSSDVPARCRGTLGAICSALTALEELDVEGERASAYGSSAAAAAEPQGDARPALQLSLSRNQSPRQRCNVRTTLMTPLKNRRGAQVGSPLRKPLLPLHPRPTLLLLSLSGVMTNGSRIQHHVAA